ncbi:alpha/beta fold hydrolase [Rhodococcus kronopolitis]|uniref:Alpha/beta fold hydrolase n=1 Tax=Rhodococcus kronopolitis TaxID=1460226 RepID=A0ABV9FPR1_9NOCA
MRPRSAANDVPTDSVEVGEFTFDVTAAGPPDGPPTMLLHGFPQTPACWRALTPLLTAAGLRVIAPAQRGYSPRARPVGVEHYAMPHLVADVVGLLDALDIDSVHLVGHDWGAAVAWALTAAHPERVRTLTAVSVPHPGAFSRARRENDDQRDRSRYIDLFRDGDRAERLLLADAGRRLRAVYDDVDPARADVHVRALTEPGALTAALSWYRAMDRTMNALPPVRVPTTYVWSTADTAIGRAGAQMCGEFVDAPYRFVELDGVSHWIPEVAAPALAEAVLARVKGNER